MRRRDRWNERQRRSDRARDPFERRAHPQRVRHFQLNAARSAASIADVFGTQRRVSVALCGHLQPRRAHGIGDQRFQRVVPSPEKHLWLAASAAVNRENSVALCDQAEALRFVEPVACQVERAVVVRLPDALEKIEVVLIARDRPREFGRSVFDLPAVRGNHRERYAGDTARCDLEIVPAPLLTAKVGV